MNQNQAELFPVPAASVAHDVEIIMDLASPDVAIELSFPFDTMQNTEVFLALKKAVEIHHVSAKTITEALEALCK